QTVGWIDLLIAAPGQGGAEARLTHLLLMVRLKTLAPRHDLGQRLELCRRDGSAKGLDPEGLNRRSIEMGPSCFGEGAVPIRAERTRAGTIGHIHPPPAPAAGAKPFPPGSALAGRSLPSLPLPGAAPAVRTPAPLLLPA